MKPMQDAYINTLRICETAEKHAIALISDIKDESVRAELIKEGTIKQLSDVLYVPYEVANKWWDFYQKHKKKTIAVLEKGSYTDFSELENKQKG